MASTFQYQFQPQPPPIPRMTGGKRGPSGPLTVPSSSEDEDSDTSECAPLPQQSKPTQLLQTLPGPRFEKLLTVTSVSSPHGKIVGGKVLPTPLSPRRDTVLVVTTTETVNHGADADSYGETTPSLPSSPRLPVTSPPVTSPPLSSPSPSRFAHEHDHDYDNVASPCSSTASGPIYVRPPGFTHHAQEVESVKSKIVRKKSRPAAVISLKDGFKRREQTPPKAKPRREPLPMKLRALPQSFWQQPNVPQQVSPATNFRVLPPLCNKDTEEDMTEVRPVTPPLDDEHEKRPPPAERRITVANTDLLFKLFENIGDEKKTAATLHIKKDRRIKRAVVKTNMKGLLSGNDPYLVDAMADSLFPQLSIETSRHSGNTSLQLVTFGTGDKSVTLPSLTIEQNYPQMLSELVMHI